MKGVSKPLSSPSRAEKFPPPLMRFLRSNVGSRSRSRSRSSPMFYLRGRRSAIETTQEPSSPKVTCIGQVRVRRSKARRAVNKRRWSLRKSLCFGNTSAKFLPRRAKNPFGGMLCKCGSIFGLGYSKKVDSTDSFRGFSDSRSGKIENLDAANNGHCSSNESERDYTTGSLESKRGFLEPSSSSSPPKNALMLTRCRSAPYRSSSLGGRFWGSPIEEKDDDNGGKSDQVPASSSTVEEELEQSCKQMESRAEEFKKIGGGAVHPLLLTRCKSEPARTGERLVAEAILLRQTR
ncbi:uncharacterized protein LOC130997655 isoform X2 [Salvia miltiorrhiza]|uniref:uncharacterized protein LOC130997655 isoform X1 n=1 Tax=Salvia miltiorrhiza TaxID=226208 RepID=UPI0025AB97B3|nr:uncharacterized protein LOC130997655 isoform X1 [Salvia miltiorrhiza]XP_057779036.1 uncharacterized protein LOC130997655 isoform X2 [Salvia miltiorrhiza]